jgi:hypothetical protein
MCRRFFYYWRTGRSFKIPRCCVLRFSMSLAFSGRRYHFARYGRYERSGPDDGWIPCGVFHQANRCGACHGEMS